MSIKLYKPIPTSQFYSSTGSMNLEGLTFNSDGTITYANNHIDTQKNCAKDYYYNLTSKQIEELFLEVITGLSIGHNSRPQVQDNLRKIFRDLQNECIYFDKKGQLKKSRSERKPKKGHVYFFESAGNHKIGKSCTTQIKKRISNQKPDKVLAISSASFNYHVLERKLHRKYAKKRMGRYEIFCGLTKKEIEEIEKVLGGINIELGVPF
tara:strand:+ start:641 stop:1267 length:627 start_codon:yes stop_codon:yes gene_type:complete